MNRSTLEMLLSTIVEQGADGLVIWGAKPDAVSAEKCEEFESWLNVTLGPLLEALPAHPNRWKSDEDDVTVLPPTHQALPVPPGINASGFRSYAFTRRLTTQRMLGSMTMVCSSSLRRLIAENRRRLANQSAALCWS